MKIEIDLKLVNKDGFPKTDGETLFIGWNEAGYCSVFNSIIEHKSGVSCMYETPKEFIEMMGGLVMYGEIPETDWRELIVNVNKAD